MRELIDKKSLFNGLFVRNGKVCPNSDIDNFPTTIDVKEVKKAILEQPTTTKAELCANVIDKFAEKLHELCGVEIGDYQYPDLLHERRIDEIASQMKGDVCKGRACCQEIVKEYSNPEGPADDQSTTKSIAKSDDKEKMELLLKHGEPETLEDLLSLFLYQYHREFDKVRIKNMIQSIQQDCAVLGIKV